MTCDRVIPTASQLSPDSDVVAYTSATADTYQPSAINSPVHQSKQVKASSKEKEEEERYKRK